MLKKLTLICSSLLALTALINCGGGGGGGGGDFIGAAQVSLRASPNTIDSGDRMEVRVIISRVDENGIILKIRYPDGLEYVPSSSILSVDSRDLDVTPAVNSGKEGSVYLVYFFSHDIFEEKERGDLTIQLEGTDGFSSGQIEVDADVDDPLISDNVEFDIENPEFVAEDSVDVKVLD